MMHEVQNQLFFTAERNAAVYFQCGNRAAVGFAAGRAVHYCLEDAWGTKLCSGCDCEKEFPEVSENNLRLTFLGDGGEETFITLFCDENALPFLMPGVGVLWNHGTVYPLLLAKEQPHCVWVPASPEETSEAVAVIKGVPFGGEIKVSAWGSSVPADWYPKLGREWFWHTSVVPASASVVKFELPASDSEVRFTVYNRVVTALEEPAVPVRWGKIKVKAADGNGSPMDARIEIFVGEERIALSDQFADEQTVLYLPEGRYRIKASHGCLWKETEVTADITAQLQEMTLTLAETVKLPEGWVFGELHTHSALEDATLFPRQVMRAARATGRAFCFMTDKTVELLETFGLHECDCDGRFLAIRGQELMAHELHMNLLNGDCCIDNPEAEDLQKPNPDIETIVQDWIAQYREMKHRRPCLLMHNHPSHRAEVMKKSAPYFRSWWVSDLFDDFRIVENCDYEGWFDRLNRKHKIYCAWTGDSHDCTLMYPGKEGICLYLGKEPLSQKSVIEALEKGHFFGTRAPGMFLEIQAKNTGMGDSTAAPGENVRVTADAGRPIDAVEVVADGKIIYSEKGEGRISFTFTVELLPDTRWVMARAKLCGTEWDRTTHSFTPFMEAGYDAFTNPIFFGW